MAIDPEILAMGAIAKELETLEESARMRVLNWAFSRFRTRLGVEPAAEFAISSAAEVPGKVPTAGNAEFADFPTFFDRANPQTAPDKALVSGYWFQVVQGQEDFDGFSLNKALKNLGHPSTNITRDLDSLMSRSPRLVMQTKKFGNTKQARKQYKLTTEGIRAVDRMLSVGNGDNT